LTYTGASTSANLPEGNANVGYSFTLHPGCTLQLYGREALASPDVDTSFPMSYQGEGYMFAGNNDNALLQTNTNTSSSPITYTLLLNDASPNLPYGVWGSPEDAAANPYAVHWYNVYASTYRLYFA
jgi:hypothetical protein